MYRCTTKCRDCKQKGRHEVRQRYDKEEYQPHLQSSEILRHGSLPLETDLAYAVEMSKEKITVVISRQR